MNIWKDCKKIPLPETLTFIVDNRGKTVPLDDDGEHILIATNCIRNEKLYPSYEKIRRLSEEIYQTWFRAHPLPGDIIFVCKGTPGRTCMVPDPVDFCIAQDMVALRANESIVYNKYLLAVLRSWQVQEQITNTSVGDVIPHFKKQFFSQILIPIPPMGLQKKIGDLYYEIALLEEKNNKINENLEHHGLKVLLATLALLLAEVLLLNRSPSIIRITVLPGLPQRISPSTNPNSLRMVQMTLLNWVSVIVVLRSCLREQFYLAHVPRSVILP